MAGVAVIFVTDLLACSLFSHRVAYTHVHCIFYFFYFYTKKRKGNVLHFLIIRNLS